MPKKILYIPKTLLSTVNQDLNGDKIYLGFLVENIRYRTAHNIKINIPQKGDAVLR